MIFRSIPSAPSTEQFRHRQASLPFSYSNQNGTQTASEISGFDNDRAEVLLGKGELVWEKAKQAIDAWNSFPKDWTRVFPKSAPTNPGTTIVMYARFAGLWWRNACRMCIHNRPSKPVWICLWYLARACRERRGIVFG